MSKLPATRWRPAFLACALALSLSPQAFAQSNPYQRGPVPTTAELEADLGPYAIGSATIARQTGFGGGTVYFPTTQAEGPFGLIVVAPGFIETQASTTFLGKKWASHGFVVVTINVLNIFEYPTPRARELKAALAHVVAQAGKSGTPYFGKVDPNRQAVAGHSMGGGGTLEAARDNPQLKAAVPLAPWNLQKSFSTVSVPTLIVSCEKDVIAPNDTHSQTFYASLPATTPKALLDIKGADHMCPTTATKASNRRTIGKYSTAWLKRFVDEDTRFSPVLCGSDPVNDASTGAFVASYRANCPY